VKYHAFYVFNITTVLACLLILFRNIIIYCTLRFRGLDAPMAIGGWLVAHGSWPGWLGIIGVVWDLV